MSRKARNRAAVAVFLALVAGGILGFGQVSGTFAIFSAETNNTGSTLNGSWIPAPSAATSSLDGTPYSQEHLAWTSGSTTAMPGAAANPVTGQSIYYADGGSGTSASCGSYGSFSTTTAAATSADLTGTNLADWWCFEVFSTSSAATTSGTWTSDPVTFTPRRILVVTAVAIANGGSGSNRMNSGDTITITFNQNVNLPGTANHFCGVNNGANDVIFIGDTRATGTCAATDSYTIAKITGVTISASTTPLTESLSQPAANQIKVQITANSTSTATGVPTSTFLIASNITAATGSQPACISTSAPTCTVTPTGNF